LISLGRLVGVDVLYLTRGSFWLGTTNVVSGATAFILALAFGNLVSPETYGTYRFVLSFYSILALTGLSGFGPAVVRAVAKGFEGDFFRSFKIQMFGSTAGSLISFGIAVYYFLHHNSTLGAGFIVLGLVLPFIESLTLYGALLAGRREFKKSAKYDIIAQLLATGALLGAIFLRFNVVGLLLTFFSAWVGIRLFLFFYIIRKFQPNKKIEEKTMRLGSHLTLMGVLNSIAAYLDKIAIFHYLGAAEVAIYSFAMAPPEQLKGLFKNIGTLAVPRFSQRTEEELKKTMLKKTLLAALAVGICIAAYVIAAPLFFKILFPKYLSSIFLSQIFAVSLFGVIANLPVSAMKALSKIKELYFYNIVSSIITIALVLVLTPSYGLMGVVMARLLARLSGVLISFAAFYF
jgi:O-antigen/teichoic acid export membrane protein